jgi:hypothetical protein
MQKTKLPSLFSKFTFKSKSFKIIAPILLVTLLSVAMITPLYAQLTPARDLTGTWRSGVSGVYYDMDPSDGSTPMNDITATYRMDITQTGSQIQIVFYTYPTSYKTDTAYWNEYGMAGVPPVSGGDILFKGTVSGASFSADEYPASSLTQEHLAGTFTTDIITATLSGLLYTSDTNGIIVIRSGSSATVPPIATVAPTATPALPTSDNLGGVSQVQGSASFADSGSSVTTQSSIGTGAEIKTGSDTIVAFNYPDIGGTVYLGSNSDAAWVYPEKQTDPMTGNITYSIVPSPTTGSIPFETGAEADEFGQVAITLPIEIGVGMLLLGETLPIALTGAAVVEGTMLLGTGIAYIHEQLSPQEGTLDVRPVQVPQGMVMGSGTDYVVTVSNDSTTIQVMDGSVIFVDQYTNNTITVGANQMLTLPSGITTGFTTQDLQSKVSAFDASSINQWWKITPIATPMTPTNTPAAPTDTAAPTNPLTNAGTDYLSDPMILAIILLIVIVVVVVLIAGTKQKRSSQPRMSNRKSRNQKITSPNKETAVPIQPETTQPTGVFCPNCGNQLLDTKGSCPFCHSDLSQWYSNNKK